VELGIVFEDGQEALPSHPMLVDVVGRDAGVPQRQDRVTLLLDECDLDAPRLLRGARPCGPLLALGGCLEPG
jgi:hypothetical protein